MQLLPIPLGGLAMRPGESGRYVLWNKSNEALFNIESADTACVLGRRRPVWILRGHVVRQCELNACAGSGAR